MTEPKFQEGEYIDPEFPEMESQPEEIPEPEWDPESEALDEEFYEETPTSDGFEGELERMESEMQEVSSALEYPPRESPTVISEDSGGVLFLPDDDPIQQPLISEPLDPRLVYTRPVSKRLRHLTCERRGSEYSRPAGVYRPKG